MREYERAQGHRRTHGSSGALVRRRFLVFGVGSDPGIFRRRTCLLPQCFEHCTHVSFFILRRGSSRTAAPAVPPPAAFQRTRPALSGPNPCYSSEFFRSLTRFPPVPLSPAAATATNRTAQKLTSSSPTDSYRAFKQALEHKVCVMFDVCAWIPNFRARLLKYSSWHTDRAYIQLYRVVQVLVEQVNFDWYAEPPLIGRQ